MDNREIEIKIYSYYLRQEIGENSYCSPIPARLRGGKPDNTPSFNLRVSKDGRLRWRDFGNGSGGDCYDLIILIEPTVRNLIQAKNFYNRRIKPLPVQIKPIQKRSRKKGTEFTVEARSSLTANEMQVWEPFLITQEQLQFEHIYASDGLRFNTSDKVYYKSTDDNPTFIYDLCPDIKQFAAVKIYQPYAKEKRDKWRNWWTETPITGTYGTTLPATADILIITSSRKDKMAVNNSGFAADNLLSETDYHPYAQVRDEYNERFIKKYSLMDGDSAGRKSEIEINKLYPEIEPMEMRYPENTKDPAEIVKQYRQEVLTALIKEKIK